MMSFFMSVAGRKVLSRCVVSLYRPSLAAMHFSSASSAPATADNLLRLSKFIAETASMSRREAERLIRSGEVTLAGQVIQSPQIMVERKALQNNALKVQGKVVAIDESATHSSSSAATATTGTRVWLAHKLPGEIVSDEDPLGRPSLMQRLTRGGVGKQGKKDKQLHLKPVGRLDMPTEGLILLTNDGKYARELELPATKMHRVYRVRAHGNVTEYKLAQMQRGLTIEGVRYSPMKVQLDAGKNQSATKWLQVTCTEGKNRQIRKVFKHLGLDVARLIRTSYGDYKLDTIPPGMAIEVPCKQVESQRKRGHLFPKRPKVVKATSQQQQPNEDGEKHSSVRWVRYL